MALPLDALEPVGWRLVFGLGNPGPEYAGTRHNVGFDVLDLLVARRRLRWESGGSALRAAWPEFRCLLVKPLTFMNRSGSALRQAWRDTAPDGPGSLFVVTDDFHLPLGGLRLRTSGSTGGHNGLASLEEALGSQDYPRLRVGVGDPGADSVDFVLTTFSPAERPVIEESLLTASWCVEDWVLGASLDALQTRYNRRLPQAES
jgi:PTH1 family peptidyl-tRNA hydrolase